MLHENIETTSAPDESADHEVLLSLTSEIVSAHVANNAVPAASLPEVIATVFETLSRLGAPEVVPEEAPTPAVPVKKSVHDDYLICLEDGKKLKMLKRHLATSFGMTPAEYRARWGLPADYPMVAPAYARTRQELAKRIGLGRKPKEAPEPAPAPAPAKRGRRKTAA